MGSYIEDPPCFDTSSADLVPRGGDEACFFTVCYLAAAAFFFVAAAAALALDAIAFLLSEAFFELTYCFRVNLQAKQ